MKHIYVMSDTHKDMRGFEYLLYSTLSLVLLVVFILLPIAPVFANEIESTATDPVSDAAALSETPIAIPGDSDGIDKHTSDVDVVSQDTFVVHEGEEDSHTTSVEESGMTYEPSSDQIVENISQAQESPFTSGLTDSEVSLENEAPVPSSDTAIEESLDESNDSRVTEEGVDAALVSHSTGTETLLVATSTTGIHTVTNEQNKFIFSEDECTLARDGAFYCAKAANEARVTNADRIFSAPDRDGDAEIYIEKGGEITALTSNTYDDESPYFDEVSNTMVWHRLIDGRYQIISFDIETGEETQLTHDRFNNMEPSRVGDITVWQGWVGDDWEIFSLQGDELSMLTDNTTHDITPNINSTYLIWQSFEENSWKMKVYDFQTGSIETVENTEGGSISNPRFVLVYDTKYETGDIETKGFDLQSGESLTLGVLPAQVPDELPDPEQTGEERALVTSQTQLKTKSEGEIDDGTPDNDVLDEEFESAEMDIIIPPLLEEEGVMQIPSEHDVLFTNPTESVADIIVTPYVEEIEDSILHIEDVIITPFIEPIQAISDSQQVIVSER